MHLAATAPEQPPVRAQPFARIAVLGGGAWGTALAAVAVKAGRGTTLWARSRGPVRDIAEGRGNPTYLPGVPLPPGIVATDDLARAVQGADAVVIVVPSTAIRELCARLAPLLPPDVPVAICAKGIEHGTGLLMTSVAGSVLGHRPVGVISGPTFAREVALDHPTAATVSFEFAYADRLAPGDSPAARLAVSLTTPAFRAYVSDDVVGVEVCGAIKNVIAIACGMMTGAGFAENTRAALITRGLAETLRLVDALGGRAETVTGLAGIGDLTLTCSSPTSRNMSLGIQLGQGVPRAACFGGRAVVVEGEPNAITVTDLARRLGLVLPICEAVRGILHDGARIDRTFRRLWSAPIAAEPRAMARLLFDHPAGSDED